MDHSKPFTTIERYDFLLCKFKSLDSDWHSVGDGFLMRLMFRVSRSKIEKSEKFSLSWENPNCFFKSEKKYRKLVWLLRAIAYDPRPTTEST